jgi:hypothetical protein
MKVMIIKNIPILLFYMLFDTNLYSQTDSSFYFSMNPGNIWQYKEPPPPEDLYPQEVRLGRDTTFSNGHTYRSFVNKYIGYSDTIGLIKYERQIDSRVYRYYPQVSQEYLIYDFSKEVDDTISIFPNPLGYKGDTSIIMVIEKGIKNIFGSSRTYMKFYTQTTYGVLYWIDEVVDGIGLTFDQSEPGYQLYLVGAIIDGVSYGTVTNVSPTINTIPNAFMLYQNYPNPFNPSTTINVRVPKGESYKLFIYDILGKQIRGLYSGKGNGDVQAILWDGKNDIGIRVSSGLYFYQIRGQSISMSKKMLLIQ